MSWLKLATEFPRAACEILPWLLRGQLASRLASFRRGHCAAISGATQVVLRVALTDIRRRGRCHCPVIAGKLHGFEARNFAGCLAGSFRGHRVTVSRDSAQLSASFWRAVKTLSRQGVRLVLHKSSICSRAFAPRLKRCCTGFFALREHDRANLMVQFVA